MGVESDGTGEIVYRTSGMPTDTGNWTMFVIARFLAAAYTDSFSACLTFMDSDGNPSLQLLTESAAADTIDAQLYTGSATNVVMSTGAYTGWFAFALTHASGATVYKPYFWKEGELGFTQKSDLTNGSQQTPLSYYVVGASGLFDVTHVRIHKAAHRATEMSLADLDLTLRNAHAFDGSGWNTWLELTNNANATTNEGTAGVFTQNNTFADYSDETPCLPGHADAWFAAAALQDA